MTTTDRARRHPGVAVILLFIVLVPAVTTAVFVSLAANASWANRQDSRRIAGEVTRLTTIAQSRARLNSAEVPLGTLAAGVQVVGLTEAQTSAVMNMDLKDEIPREAAAVAADPVLRATPTLRADEANFERLSRDAPRFTVSYPRIEKSTGGFGNDLDTYWLSTFNRLQTDIRSWNAPQEFEIHVGALRQTYQALIDVGHVTEGTALVLESSTSETTSTGMPAGEELISDYGSLQVAEQQLAGALGPRGVAAWARLRHDPADVKYDQTVATAFDVAVHGIKSPYIGNPTFAGNQLQAGLTYFDDVTNLVHAAATDLHDEATTQANNATASFIAELVILSVVSAVCVVAVVGGSRALTRPLRRLSHAAQQIHDGEFDLDDLPDRGPAEVITVNAAFNNMASTLKGVEAKTVALASEDLANPELQAPLPGRVGAALQAAVDKLVSRIRERESQRQQLHEAATHDRLTGLLNRAATFEFLSTDVERRRKKGEKVAVLFADLNGLKPLNDTYGHEAGDAAIRFTAEALHEALGACDVVGRLGGDEFLVILCSEHSRNPDVRVQQIHDAISRRSVPVRGGQFVPLEASVGTALANCDASTDPMTLVRRADEAMYEAKRAARATRDHLAAASAAANAATSASQAAMVAARTGSELAAAALAAANRAATAASTTGGAAPGHSAGPSGSATPVGSATPDRADPELCSDDRDPSPEELLLITKE